MKSEENNMEMEHGDQLLDRLLYLKRYEKPDAYRMTRNRQNIMREVRQLNGNRRRSLADLVEVSIPWFFAEPRYGMALLFVAFAALQFLGVQSQKHEDGTTGIYTSGADFSNYETTSVATNRISYPQVPKDFQLFPDRQNIGDIKFVGRLEPHE